MELGTRGSASSPPGRDEAAPSRASLGRTQCRPRSAHTAPSHAFARAHHTRGTAAAPPPALLPQGRQQIPLPPPPPSRRSEEEEEPRCRARLDHPDRPALPARHVLRSLGAAENQQIRTARRAVLG